MTNAYGWCGIYSRIRDCSKNPRCLFPRASPGPRTINTPGTGLPSDPVYVVYADKKGPAKTDRPEIYEPVRESCDPSELDSRMKKIKDTCCCPYCGERMLKWEVPDNPFGQTWDNEYMYICFNDNCSYYVRGCDNLMKSVGRHSSYRLMWNPEKRLLPARPCSLSASPARRYH